jgi:tungstate transport system permease protein
VHFIWEGVRGAAHLLSHPDSGLWQVMKVTLEVAGGATLLAALIGVPLGAWLGLAGFRGRRVVLAFVNAGLGLPPVVVGLVVALFLFRNAPLGELRLIYTVRGVILAQAILAVPIVAAFTATAVQQVDSALLQQARALGASRLQVTGLALREGRVGVVAALLGAVGSALSEVGAVVLVGGNIEGQTQTLSSAVLGEVSAGRYSRGIALGTILLGLILAVSAGFTLAQPRAVTWRPW